MGDIADLIDKVVYLDSNVFIYAVEGFAQHRPFIEELFRQIDGGRIDAVTSELTMAEVLVKPFEAGREDIGDLYRELLQTSGHLTVVPIDRSILMQACTISLRARGQAPRRHPRRDCPGSQLRRASLQRSEDQGARQHRAAPAALTPSEKVGCLHHSRLIIATLLLSGSDVSSTQPRRS